MDNMLVTIGAVGLIGFIGWWFFAKRQTAAVKSVIVEESQQVEVVVNGGYLPNTVVLQRGIPATIIFNRQDPSGCFDEVVLPDFGIRQVLPVGEPIAITIDTTRSGHYQYACGMNMFFGKVVVE